MIPTRLQPLLAADGPAMALASRFAEAGHSLFLVGGSLRDLLLDRPAGDLDFATEARPDDIKAVVGPWATDMYLMGETFGTIGAVRDGHIYEITTFRSEVYRDESRKPRVTFSDDIETDLSRRDFAVNAMALRLPTAAGDQPEMIDPFGGLADLAAQTLRTPIDPHVSFGDDPLRMLRLYRFMSTLGFGADPAAEDAVGEMKGRLSIVSAERIRDEFAKLMVGDHVARAVEALVTSGLAAEFLPELPALAMEQDPMHR
ncbi:MAG: CCA tRNA nucleotidyltransferase, partial [Acidimicrobiia bacterium]|nr:CCA tRNA nucleotidyltransferase [Acidimicrobiia bacterium]